MDALIRKPTLVLACVAVLLVVILGGQLLADTVLAQDSFTTTGEAMGRAGFAYLTGVRTFAAALLWNRLDPIYHQYYHDKPLADQTQTLPTINLITTLDPGFVEAYNLGAWIVVRRGLVDEAIDLSKRGIDNNPRSGLLRVDYAQILWLYGDDPQEVLRQADIAFSDEVEWRDLFEQHDEYAVLRTLYKQNSELEKSEAVMAEIERLDLEIGDAMPTGTHDHDGDGVPDH